MFLKDRAMAEQFDRESTESVLQQDLTDARQEIGEMIELLVLYCSKGDEFRYSCKL